jgi:hypothetical protein
MIVLARTRVEGGKDFIVLFTVPRILFLVNSAVGVRHPEIRSVGVEPGRPGYAPLAPDVEGLAGLAGKDDPRGHPEPPRHFC